MSRLIAHSIGVIAAIVIASYFSNTIPTGHAEAAAEDLFPYKQYLPTVMNGPVTVLIGAGDISICGRDTDDQTAKLLGQTYGEIFTAGDSSNQTGTLVQYQECFTPSWGQYFSRIHPTAGNHDYLTPGASGYYQYFGARAGESGKGYYSYTVGEWRIIVLNGNCLQVGGCQAGSPQETWLREDLAAHPALCSLAYWHQPLFTSGYHGSTPEVKPLWEALYEYGVDVVLNGHDHDYERFAPQTPDGLLDLERGIREFVVGTGGAPQRAFGVTAANSEARHFGEYGVLKLNLNPDAYTWEFIPVAGGTFTDQGETPCHE